MIKAKYTIVLETLLSDEKVKPLIDKALSTYPMYVPVNENNYSIIPTRETLNSKILNHYKYREIGFETIGRFIDELQIAMEEIMPYYYQLYKSADIMNGIEDPFGNVDIMETFEEERSDNSTGNSKDNVTSNSKDNVSGNSKDTNKSNTETNTETSATDKTTTTENMTTDGKSVKNDTPQGMLNIVASDIDSIPYASEVNWNKSNSNSKGTSEGESGTTGKSGSETSSETTSENSSESISENSSETTSEHSSEKLGTTKNTLHRKGNHGVNTYAHDMKELRETFLNIERQIINDERIQELFMLVY